MNEPENWPAGTLRYRRDDGSFSICSPHDALYSTVTMCATEWWDGGSNSWQPILAVEDDET